MFKEKFRLKKDMLNMMTQTIAIFIFQLAFCLFILKNSVIDQASDETLNIIPTIDLAMARFITGIAMHVNMTNEINMGLNKMKFALNHKWKFSRWRYAYMAGLCQASITFLVTIISYFVLIFSDNVLDIVKDFLALEVIS